MSQDLAKRAAAEAALAYVPSDEVLGVGTGSTVNFFIDALAARIKSGKLTIPGAVSSSEASTARLRSHDIAVLDPNKTGTLSVYIDGADEVDPHLRLIKGGGGALTREKIIAEASRKFVCIADASKQVRILGGFPLPIEVLPMAQSLIGRKLVVLGGTPKLRGNFVTDNGNVIIDVSGLSIVDPLGMEAEINQWPGVVCVGLFARRKADVLLMGSANGVEKITA